MAALGTFVAGPYTLTMDAVAVGLLDPQGERGAIQIRVQSFHQVIQGHEYALTPIDAVYRGGDHRLSFIAEEQISGAMKAFWPFSATATATYAIADMATHGQVGRLGTTIGKNIVLTAVAGTTAAASPATLTALVYPTEETKEMVFDAVLRKFPCDFRMILQDYTAVKKFWTST